MIVFYSTGSSAGLFFLQVLFDMLFQEIIEVLDECGMADADVEPRVNNNRGWINIEIERFQYGAALIVRKRQVVLSSP